jgi:hypothetical protein
MAKDGWIKLRYDIAGHSNVHVLADRCNCTENEALGALARFWIAVARLPEYDEKNDTAFFAKGVSEKTIDRIAALSGFAQCVLSLGIEGNRWLEFDSARQQFCVKQVDKWINSEQKRKLELERDTARKKKGERNSAGIPPEVQTDSPGKVPDSSYLLSLSSTPPSMSSGESAERGYAPIPPHAVVGFENGVWDAWEHGGVLPAAGKSIGKAAAREAIGLLSAHPEYAHEPDARKRLALAAVWLEARVIQWRESPRVKAKCPGWNVSAKNWFESRRYEDGPNAWNNDSDSDQGRGQQPTVAQRADAGKYRRNGEQAGTAAPGVSSGASQDGAARVVNW